MKTVNSRKFSEKKFLGLNMQIVLSLHQLIFYLHTVFHAEKNPDLHLWFPNVIGLRHFSVQGIWVQPKHEDGNTEFWLGMYNVQFPFQIYIQNSE